MERNEGQAEKRIKRGRCKIRRERLKGTNIELTSFVFHPGGNVYVFGYERGGSRKYTFIDSGDRRYADLLMNLLFGEGIDPANIERIIITHRHLDHCGLTGLLAGESDATIIAHPGFRNFVEGRLRKEERWWLRGFDPTGLNKYNIVYPPMDRGEDKVNIGGLEFPRLGEPVEIGEEGKLEILACPESENSHTDDQLIVLYSPSDQLRNSKNPDNDFLPTDDIIFCGDLWLMQGPLYESSLFRNISTALRFMRYRIMSRLSGNPMPRINIREQDADAKEALKTGFFMIRVKPGHGEEFLGSRIIPKCVFAERDLLVTLGFDINHDKSILKSDHIAPGVEDLRERAYADFIRELSSWQEWGYSSEEISSLLVRIFREQRGGGGSIKRDRQERRRWIKGTLGRLKKDTTKTEELRGLAKSTLLQI